MGGGCGVRCAAKEVREKGFSPVNLSSCATSAIGLKIKNIKKLRY
jgi:hypothetical protein